MEIEIWVVIHFLWRKRYRNPDILSELEYVYGQGVMTLRTVERRRKVFTEKHTTLDNSLRRGRPTRNDVTDVVNQIIHGHRFCSQNRIAEQLTVHRDVVKRIRTEELGLRKTNFRWISHKLTTDPKAVRLIISRQLLTLLDRSSEQKQCDIFTGDETWIHAARFLTSQTCRTLNRLQLTPISVLPERWRGHHWLASFLSRSQESSGSVLCLPSQSTGQQVRKWTARRFCRWLGYSWE
jgi:hypothetical protein